MTKLSYSMVILQSIRKLTVERKHLNAVGVTKLSLEIVILLPSLGHTQRRNHSYAASVTKYTIATNLEVKEEQTFAVR